MTEHRPNPDNLLQQAQKEEQQKFRGRLKIYLGAAPGVGKTYTMLHDALAQRAKGLDVVIGLIESHGRREINNLLKDFEIIPRAVIAYHGTRLFDFDLNAALNRHAGLILIDEMAHTNAPGSRHNKRWQDIKELLDRGIDVYTTLNVQHIESLNDAVSHIIHAPIRETVPDSMIEMAESIELVDIPADELLVRLHEGKVYLPEQASIASEMYFTKGNLIALRELALRTAAERVGAEVQSYRSGLGIRSVWRTKDKILVCVGSGPESLKVIRAAKRMATGLQCEWIAVHIDSIGIHSTEDKRHRALQNLRFAAQLGAETRVLIGFDIVKEVMDFAREQNVTQIMIWKHIRKRWRNLFFRSLVDEIVRNSEDIDVYIMTGEIENQAQTKLRIKPVKIAWRGYGISLLVVGLATAFDILLQPYLASSNLIMVYLLGVTFVALLGKMGPSIVASILSVLAYDFFFVPPFYSFAVNDIQYLFTLIVMLIVSQVISQLTLLTRRQAEVALDREHQTSALYKLSRKLARTRGTANLLNVGINYIAALFDSDILALLPENSSLVICAKYRTNKELNEKEQGVAQWVYELGQPAGLGTDSLSFSDSLYLPLLATHGVIGVLRIHPAHHERFSSPETMRLLEAIANQLALALEVDRFQNLALEMDEAKLHKQLLSINLHITLIAQRTNEQLGESRVQVDVPKDLPLLQFDEALMQVVFINLIDNAVKYSPAKTPISISAFMEGNHLLITVSDYGPGIRHDEAEKLFDTFYRGEMFADGPGLGLGLAICRSVIKAHGGEIWVENAEGGGTIFFFTLPLNDELTTFPKD